MDTILHKLPNGGVGNYPPNPAIIALMTGVGLGWSPAEIDREVSKLMLPASGWAGFAEPIAREWVEALAHAGLTQPQALDLFTRRVQARHGYTVSTIVDDAEISTHIIGDRYFRDAVVWDDVQPDKCRCDMPKARGIHMDRIRQVRNAELVKEDITFMRAVEAGDASAQSTVATKKQVLRDIPATFDITTGVTTLELLKAKWPAELPARE